MRLFQQPDEFYTSTFAGISGVVRGCPIQAIFWLEWGSSVLNETRNPQARRAYPVEAPDFSPANKQR